MVVRVNVSPDLLRWAVQRAGWDEDTTARRAPKLYEWESGAQRPTLKQLEKFALATHAPFGMLFLPEPPIEEVPIPDLRTIGNAGVSQPSADLLDTIYICQARQDWYKDYVLENGVVEPEFVGSATTSTDPELVASQIRNFLDFNVDERSSFLNWEDALRRLIDRIENIGVLVMVNGVVGANTHRKLNPEEFRGFALSDNQAPLIFINGADTKAARIFSLFHELAHIWLGHSALSNANMATRNNMTEELWCNQVAAEVLVPVVALHNDYRGDQSTQELERLAKKYRVSTLVVLKRIFDAGYLGWTDYRTRYDNERDRLISIIEAKRSSAPGGNFYNTQPLRLSRQFAQAVISSAFEGSTTYREAYRLLGTRKHATFENLAADLGVA